MKTSLVVPIVALVLSTGVRAQATPAHNVVLFVADGLRPGLVDREHAPALDAFMKRGVRFTNTHSMFPTFTTANASAMATGHKLGDTGDFSNVIDAGFPVPGAGDSLTPFLEADPVLGDVDEHFSGDYLNQDTVMKAAREAGYGTATIGKLGPALIFDHTERTGEHTIVIDDSTGSPAGIPLGAEVRARMTAANLPLVAPPRGDNGKAGNQFIAGTLAANLEQQNYFTDCAAKIVLPLFAQRRKPFMLVFWSRDPDGTQHNQGDSLSRLVPGINGPTSFAAIRNADGDLVRLLDALAATGLAATTDVIVASDHGFSTISKESATSYAGAQDYADVPARKLPPGFVAIDLATALDAPLLDPDNAYAAVDPGTHPSRGNGLIGGDKSRPDVVVAANGGSDLVYLPSGDRDLAKRVVRVLQNEDYVSGLFVSDGLGPIAGTLPISAVDLKGSAVTPLPAIVVNFRTYASGCERVLTCGIEVADTGLQQGQGMHGSFSRADTSTLGGAAGPDFRRGLIDAAPESNADIGKTMAHILRLHVRDVGKLVGRVLYEAMPGGAMPTWTIKRIVSAPDDNGRVTAVQSQILGDVRYFDAAGYPGLSLGL